MEQDLAWSRVVVHRCAEPGSSERRYFGRVVDGKGARIRANDQYLCIVPGQSQNKTGDVFLPFKGDQRLSIILSKALLLAADDKITDRAILSQIG